MSTSTRKATTVTMTARRRGFFYVQLTVLGFLHSGITTFTDGFPSNLIVSKIGCMTELSTEEVIMNNVVKSPDDSDFPRMHLVVLDSSRNHLESPYHYTADETDISIAFINPYSEDEFLDDLQFVLEVEGAASFVDGGTIGCDGDIRVSARLAEKDGEVVLRIADPTAKLRVWGGWATGYNSVRLTPNLILEPAPVGTMKRVEGALKTPTEEDGDMLQGKELGTIPSVEDSPNSGDETPPEAAAAIPKKNVLQKNAVPAELEELAKRAGHMKQKISHNRENDPDSASHRHRGVNEIHKVVEGRHFDLKEKARKHAELAKNRYKDLPKTVPDDKADKGAKDGEDNDAEPLNAQRLAEELKLSNYIDKKRKISDEKSARHIKHLQAQMREKYTRADDSNDLHMVSFGIGCVFFILSVGSILIIYGKKRDKGRRDL
jgi:hypothetical protein